jgi:hypothetical protein
MLNGILAINKADSVFSLNGFIENRLSGQTNHKYRKKEVKK